jgi:hydroxypyruvate isomerase
VAEIGREAAARAAGYFRDGVDRATDYAHHLGDVASGRIADVTGQPPEHWARQVRHVVEQSPLKALGLAIAAGYLLGRTVRRS